MDEIKPIKKVFVTGSNGLLGSNLIEELLNLDYHVKGLVRNPATYVGFRHPHLELVKGSLFDDLRNSLKDCSFVIHVAAETSPDLLNYSDYQETNVKGTLNLLHAAIDQKLEKFIFVSTANTIGYADDFNKGEEHQPMKSPYDQSFYALSKLEAEEKILQYSDRIDIIIANPTFMLGSYDTKPSSGRIILMGLNNKIIFYPPGGKNFVNAKDAALGLVRCMELGRNSEKYILAGENLTYKEFFEKLSTMVGRKPIFIKIPKAVLVLFGLFGEILRNFRIKTSLSKANMLIVCINNFYSNDKSKKYLKIRYYPIEKGITEAIDFFKKNKKIKF
ncbi:NAD-dependent epimerase/dehydratase family protein [Shivajiella indica]|uniref:NAD-dependent epimerase/dehydratase family protein n=1 Tax=Shivajiella indica TaxID=872115 RepID=A0ABW5B8H4_9BACT